MLPEDLWTRLQEAIRKEKEAHAITTKAIRKDKKAHWDKAAEQIEAHMTRGQLAEAFKMAKVQAGLMSHVRHRPTDASGLPPTSQDAELQIWATFLHKERGMLEIQEALGDIQYMEQEIRAALQRLRPNKAVCQGTLPAVVWKQLAKELARPLVPIFEAAANEIFPRDWSQNSLVWLKKPGKRSTGPDSFRDICLMSAVAKAYSQTLFWRIKEEIHDGLLPTQYGFLPGRATRDALAMASDIQERCKRAKVHLMVASFDLKQAFYRLDRALLEEMLWARLSHEATTLQVLRRVDHVEYLLHQGTAHLRLTAPMGVVVGDVLGPLLFTCI
jgi:hypothetical protein